MTPQEAAALGAKLDALHEDVREVRDLALETNGRVRGVELWQAHAKGFFAGVAIVGPLMAAAIAAVLTKVL